ncbi:MAG: metallophosphoesterase [Thermodesulfobacteriota bacterium]
MSISFSIGIISDTHFRARAADRQAAFASDALQNGRSLRAVELLKMRNPAFLVHLGDVAHPLPRVPGFADATAVARKTLAGFNLHVAPGNHDVGDKADSRATAPRVEEGSDAAFTGVWGPAWHSFDHQDCHFVLLDGCVLGSGLERERRQWEWLEADLAGHRRTFVFLHYPPFILRPDEPSHYDNVAEPARTRLLDLLSRHSVEAIFSGHVHHYFRNRWKGMEIYCLPAVAFMRPEYAEMFPVGPADENGRNDSPKLGFALLHVLRKGHRVEVVRLAQDPLPPPVPSPLGVWLRGGWAREVDLPCGDLDEFSRKVARNDWPLLALEELGIRRVRVPLADLDHARTADLEAWGFRFLPFSVGVPGEGERRLLERHRDAVDAYEVVAYPEELGATLDAVARSRIPVVLSLYDPGKPDVNGYFSHFPFQGFRLDGAAAFALPKLPASIARLVFRIPPDVAVAEGVARADAVARDLRLGALCHVELPRAGEDRFQEDDMAVSSRVTEALRAAFRFLETHLYLDTFEDKDRGYFPRVGLIDRRSNPRLAVSVVRRLMAELAVPNE